MTPGCRRDAPADEVLVRATLADRQAFGTLYERYAARVYRYERMRIGSDTIAEDILSETMLGALEALDRFNPRRGSFASWLFTIATRRIIDRQRRDSRFRFRDLLARAWEPDVTEDDAMSTRPARAPYWPNYLTTTTIWSCCATAPRLAPSSA